MSLNVLLLPALGSGHLRSLIEAGNRLVGHGTGGGDDHLGREFTVTVLVVQPSTPESASKVGAHARRVRRRVLASGSTTSRLWSPSWTAPACVRGSTCSRGRR